MIFVMIYNKVGQKILLLVASRCSLIFSTYSSEEDDSINS